MRVFHYGIRSDYRIRHDVSFWDDTQYKDEYQRPVYELARQIMVEDGLRTVLDIGTGSGWKLVHILGDFETIGTEIRPTYDFLLQRYPDRKWLLSELSMPCPVSEVDLVLSADVIEHLVDPDQLMDYVAGIKWRRLVLSTPDRDVIYGREDVGPPWNPCHVREWNAEEFRSYVGEWFWVVWQGHFGSTQVLVCLPNGGLGRVAYLSSKWLRGVLRNKLS